MHRFLRMRSLIVLLLFLTAGTVSAQLLPDYGSSRVATTGMQFLKIGPDARAASLAGNYIAQANDVASLYWNPAGITGLDTQKVHFQLGYTRYFAGIGLQYGGLVIRSGQSLWGVQIISLSSGEMKETTEFQPFGTGRTFTANSLLLGLTYARQLTENFSFGITGKYAREAIASAAAQNGLFDLGLTYNIPEKRMRFAVTITNFGFNVSPEGEFKWLRLNGETQASSFEDMAVPAIFRIGYAYDVIKKEDHKLTGILQLNHPTDNSETFGIGAEYSWRDILFLRSGYEFGVQEQSIPAAGIGLQTKRRFGRLRFDYGFNNRDRLGMIHRLTVSASIF